MNQVPKIELLTTFMPCPLPPLLPVVAAVIEPPVTVTGTLTPVAPDKPANIEPPPPCRRCAPHVARVGHRRTERQRVVRDLRLRDCVVDFAGNAARGGWGIAGTDHIAGLQPVGRGGAHVIEPERNTRPEVRQGDLLVAVEISDCRGTAAADHWAVRIDAIGP